MSNKQISVSRLFVTKCGQSSGAPTIDRGFTVEIDGAKRRGKCLVIRNPFIRRGNYKGGTALVVGLWDRPSKGQAIGPEVGSA